MPEGRRVGELGEKGEGIKHYKSAVQNSHVDVDYSIGSIVNNEMMYVFGAKWVFGATGDHSVKCVIFCPICCAE